VFGLFPCSSFYWLQFCFFRMSHNCNCPICSLSGWLLSRSKYFHFYFIECCTCVSVSVTILWHRKCCLTFQSVPCGNFSAVLEVHEASQPLPLQIMWQGTAWQVNMSQLEDTLRRNSWMWDSSYKGLGFAYSLLNCPVHSNTDDRDTHFPNLTVIQIAIFFLPI
jgi:hypothetical protein